MQEIEDTKPLAVTPAYGNRFLFRKLVKVVDPPQSDPHLTPTAQRTH
jgi:hypothetical protein